MVQLTVAASRFILLAVALAAGVSARSPVVGYTQNAPLTGLGRDGQPSGFAFDVVRAAAAREGIALDWRLVSPGQSMDSVDIWPAGVATEPRRKRFHITRSWWSSGVLLVSREPLDSPAALAGKRVVGTGDLLDVARGKLGGADLARSESHASAIRDLCEARADGFLTDRIILDRLLLHRPAECEKVSLSLTTVPGASLDLHILARPEWTAQAERLLAGIEVLKRDGTVARIALSYPAVSSGSAAFLASLVDAQHQNESLRLALWAAAVCLGVLGLALFWLMRQVDARRRTEAELRSVNQVLAEANADLEQFTYAASHDLSEPLRNMSLYSELLLRRYAGELDEQGRRYVSVVRSGALRLEQLLDGLRRYSRLSRNDELSCADAASVLAEVCASLRPQIEESGGVITSGDLPPVAMDPAWLMQVLQNLLSNALKYRGSQPPRIHVGAEQLDGAVCISVRDNGVGIGPEYRDRVFAVFKRLHGQDVPGAGIGLAICRKIVERRGGRIWVESNDGAPGSTFRFTIPVPETRDSVARRIAQAVRR